MNLSKILGKNTFVLTIAAMAALASTSASAQASIGRSGDGTTVGRSGGGGTAIIGTPQASAKTFVKVQITNQQRNACARFYLPAQEDHHKVGGATEGFYMGPRQIDLGTMKHRIVSLETGKQVRANVFIGKCRDNVVPNRMTFFTPFKPKHPADVEYFTVKNQ